jgi:hypothetical protein
LKKEKKKPAGLHMIATLAFKKKFLRKTTKSHMQKWVLSKIGSQGMRNTYFLGINKVLQV